MHNIRASEGRNSINSYTSFELNSRQIQREKCKMYHLINECVSNVIVGLTSRRNQNNKQIITYFLTIGCHILVTLSISYILKNTMVKLAQSPGKNTSCRTTFATTILSCIRFFQNTFAVVPQKCGKSCKEEKKFLSGQQWNVSAEKNFIIFQCRKEFSLSQIVDRFRLLKDYSALILKYLLVEANRIG